MGGGGLVRLIFFKDRLFGRAICQQQGVPFSKKVKRAALGKALYIHVKQRLN